MAQTSPRQRKTTGRVMHEFAHGELRSGPGGKGGKVKSRRQAIAIALKEAGASKFESPAKNRRNLKKTEGKEARGETYQQETEGKSHVGARGRREISRAQGRKKRHPRPQSGGDPRAACRPQSQTLRSALSGRFDQGETAFRILRFAQVSRTFGDDDFERRTHMPLRQDGRPLHFRPVFPARF